MDARARAKRYEKLDFLGEGQFATVFKAKDKTNNRIVAIKKIKLGHRSEAKDAVWSMCSDQPCASRSGYGKLKPNNLGLIPSMVLQNF